MKLVGEYRAKVDAKGRFRLPVGISEQLNSKAPYSFVMNRGLAKCLTLYPENVWDEETEKMDQKLDELDPDDADFRRAFYGGARPLETDGSLRLNVPDFLIEYAGIQKEVVLVCMRKKIEVWSKEVYEQDLNITPEVFARLSRKVSKKMKGETNE